MNYRHQFHAGNYADVMKHALLVRLCRGLQRKEKGFLFLDTHAGRGSYDLTRAAQGDSLQREPEWPGGIGRLWTLPRQTLPAGLLEYVDLVRDFDRRAGNLSGQPRFYPGSPALAQALARPQDRLALWERHAAEFSALRCRFEGARRVSLHQGDGYASLRAMLPPAERRALVLIDPPFEAEDEFREIGEAVAEGLRRMPGGVIAIWHPLTRRARVEEFMAAMAALRPRSALRVELTIAGESSMLRMRGCGVVVINPPWKFDTEAPPILEFLATSLAQEPGGGSRLDWLVREAS